MLLVITRFDDLAKFGIRFHFDRQAYSDDRLNLPVQYTADEERMRPPALRTAVLDRGRR
jgi:hypothetical protein